MGINPQKIEWFDGLDLILAGVLGDALEEIRSQVNSGICELWAIPGHGYTITRAELGRYNEPRDFVFVAGIGRNAIEVIEYFENLAHDRGFKGLRIHSKRLGMGRYLQKIGFEESERVYQKRVS